MCEALSESSMLSVMINLGYRTSGYEYFNLPDALQWYENGLENDNTCTNDNVWLGKSTYVDISPTQKCHFIMKDVGDSDSCEIVNKIFSLLLLCILQI